jgi:hypothetical protein
MIMFSFVLILGFVFLIFGLNEFRESIIGKKVMASSTLGFIYFLLCTIIWFILAMYWPAMATDAALGTLGLLWFGFAWVSLGFAFACIGFMLKASFEKDKGGKLQITEERSERY